MEWFPCVYINPIRHFVADQTCDSNTNSTFLCYSNPSATNFMQLTLNLVLMFSLCITPQLQFSKICSILCLKIRIMHTLWASQLFTHVHNELVCPQSWRFYPPTLQWNWFSPPGSLPLCRGVSSGATLLEVVEETWDILPKLLQGQGDSTTPAWPGSLCPSLSI